MTDTLTRETRERILNAGRDAFKEAVKEAVQESYDEQAASSRSGSRGGGGFSGLVLLGGGVALGYLLSGREAEVKEALTTGVREAREGVDVDIPEETSVEIETEYENEATDETSESTSSGRSKSLYLILLVAGLAIVGALVQKKRRGSSPMSDLDTDFSLDDENVSESDADSVAGVDTDESQGASTDEAED